MKILDVAEFYAEQGGGVKTYIDHKLRAGAEAGHQVVVVAPGAENRQEERNGGRVVWVKSPPVPGDPRYRLFVHEKPLHQVLARESADVVEASSLYGGAWFVARFPGAPVRTLVFHQDPVAVFGHSFLDGYVSPGFIDRAFSPAWSYVGRLASRFSATVVAGQWLQDRLTRFGVPRVQAVPFGIDPGPFATARPDPALRTALLERAGMPSTARLLVAVSRHHPEKRIHTLFEAVRQLNEAFPVALVLFGDGPLRSRVQHWATQVPGVVVSGYTRDRDALARAVSTADALIHGSSAETYGLVVAEALCAGTPVVVPSSGGAADLADPDRAETYRAGDATSCAAAVRRLFSRDPDALQRHCSGKAAQVRSLDAHFRDLFRQYAEWAEAPPTLWSPHHSVSSASH